MSRPIKPLIFHSLILILSCLIFSFSIKAVLSNWNKVELIALDRLRPGSFKFLYPKADINYLKLYETYFSRVGKVFSNRLPEILGLQGYCSYQRGDFNKAEQYYKKAILINPRFFWYYYNLGVIYFQQQKYPQALETFQLALNQDLQDTLITIFSSSKVYLPILTESMPDLHKGVLDQFDLGKKQALKFALLSKIKIEKLSNSFDPGPLNLMVY